MRDGRGLSQLDFPQQERERHGCKRNQHQHPEDVHIGEERRLRLDLLADPGDSLLVGLHQRASLGDKILRHLMKRILIGYARWDGVAGQHALVKLLTMREHVRGE